MVSSSARKQDFDNHEPTLNREECPEDSSNLLSKLFLWWVFPLVLRGWKSPLQDEDLWELKQEERGSSATEELKEAYAKVNHDLKGERKSMLYMAMRRTYLRTLIITAVLRGITITLNLINPILLNNLIRFVSDYASKDPKPSMLVGVGWAISLLIVPITFAIAENHYFLRTMRTGMKIKSGIQGIIYDKSLSMSPSARAGSSLGEIVNLMQMDSQKIGDFLQFIHVLWSAPVQLIVSCALLFRYIQWSAVIGVLATFIAIPIQGKLMAVLMRLRRAGVGITDQRIKLINEVMQGIKAVKFYAWEKPFSKKIEEQRDQEVETIGKTIWASSTMFAIMLSIPVIIAVITFSFYAGVFKKTLDPATVFTAFTLLNILRQPVMVLPRVLTGFIDARLGLLRIEKFLEMEDTDDYARDNVSEKNKKTPRIKIKDASFRWGEPGPPLNEPKSKTSMNFFFKLFKKNRTATEDAALEKEKPEKTIKENTLQNISIDFIPGSLTAVVGRVGSGKSSLVSAVLGEMQKTGGNVSLTGSVAYVAQTAWIFNDTLRNNILFGNEFDEALYKKAIEVSALGPDLDILPAADLTSIGEKGINLSGGQKQRVSIARAVYSNADIYIFDDPLSALDSHVGQSVFDNCISNKGALGDKLRLLITNQVSVLPECDSIVLLEHGKLRNQGTYNDLVRNDGAFREIVNEIKAVNEKEDDSVNDKTGMGEKKSKSASSKEETHPKKEATKANDKLIQAEDRNVGNIKLRSYYKYALACGGVVLFSIVLLIWLLTVVIGIGTSYWLAFWSDEQTEEFETGTTGRGLAFYIGIYFALGFGYAIFVAIQNVSFLILALRASNTMHKSALNSVLRAPMSFFDTTPIGRILSRFSRDVGAIDTNLPQAFSQMMTTVLQLIGSYILIAFIIPPFLGAAIPVTLGYWLLQRFFNRTSLEVKRLDSISKSPIYAHFSETLSGLSTLRAYGKQESAIKDNRDMIDGNTRAYFAFIASNRWFSMYLEILGSTLIFFTALISVIAPGRSTPAQLGLSLSYSLQVTGILGFTIRSITELEAQMSSVERLEHYAKELPQEDDAIRDYSNYLDEDKPGENWPAEGRVEINNISMRYREGLNLVLKGVSLKIAAGEKVGVIGRTGSGKSTLMVALLRLVELAGGTIKVDDVDLKGLGLEHIRSSITIIPQDSVLFSGTIRFNLDPFDQYSEAELWDALEKSSMKQFVVQFDGGLDAIVSEYGENLSAGQRQLICLTRALLRNSKILILDEASSSLDAETDRLIQESIRKHLKDATILTIAHRLSTLADYDKILVMESGHAVEYGTPLQLLENTDSKLNSFVQSLGPAGAQQFRDIVRKTK